mgnify:FL=1
MKRVLSLIIVLLAFSCVNTEAATISPGDIATVAYDTLEKAHGYYVNVLGQPCKQCGIAAKEWATSGDYGFGVLAHGEVDGYFWMIIEDSHWLIVNGHGSTGAWIAGESTLQGKYKQAYVRYDAGMHPWSGYESYPTKVIHGEGMGDIGVGTYSNLTSMEEFYWGGNQCKEIDDRAFYDSNALAGIKIDDTVRFINKQAFMLCPVLSDVRLSSGLEYIGARAFQQTPVSECKFPFGLKSIGRAAYSGCTRLRSVHWGKSRCKLGKYAFNNCYGLGYKVIKYLPSYLEYDSSSFRNCYGVLSEKKNYKG